MGRTCWLPQIPSPIRDFRPPKSPAASAPPGGGWVCLASDQPFPPPCPGLEAAETSPLPGLGGAREPFLMFLKGDQVRSNLLQERPRVAPSEPDPPPPFLGNARRPGSQETQGGDNLKGLQKVTGDLKSRKGLGPSPLGLGKPLAEATSPAPVLHLSIPFLCPKKAAAGTEGPGGPKSPGQAGKQKRAQCPLPYYDPPGCPVPWTSVRALGANKGLVQRGPGQEKRGALHRPFRDRSK